MGPVPGGQVSNLPPGEPIDLHTLLGQFLAVRHEVNLQTKAVRAQQEQNAESLRLLAETVEALERTQQAQAQARQQSADEQVRPLLKALLDLHDALSLAAREAQRVQDNLLPTLAQLAGEAPEHAAVEPPVLHAPPRPLLARLLGVRGVDERQLDGWRQQTKAVLEKAASVQQDRQRQTRDGVERVRQLLGSLLTGYNMGLQRVERALQQQGLEPIAAAGQPFDPERMEVLEAAANTGRPPGEVVEELRRGYLWRGRVFRFAQVRVARS